MKNTCPKCDTAYNVSAAVVGRKFTCKNCGTPVVITTAGLDYQNPPAAEPPPAARAGGGGAFNFDDDGGAAEPERKPAKVAKPVKAAKPAKRRDEEADEEPAAPAEEEELGSLPVRKPKKAAKKNVVSDFMFFREFIAPLFVKLLFWLNLVVIVLGGLGGALMLTITAGLRGALVGALIVFIGIPLNLLALRIFCELILLGFAAYDRLGEVKSLLEKQTAGTPPAPPAP